LRNKKNDTNIRQSSQIGEISEGLYRIYTSYRQ
jgi:hypothetical protein